MNKVIFSMFVIFINIGGVFSLTYGGCEYSDISRVKLLVSNINIYYDYHIVDSQDYFDITMINVPENIYIYDVNNDRYYYNSDIVDSKITIYNYNGLDGNYKFYSALSGCYGMYLGTKYYKFPKYNIYHANELCSDIPNFIACQKWVSKTYSYNEFKELVNEYKNTVVIEEYEELQKVEYKKSLVDVFAMFYVKYYYYILIGIIVICGSIILINKRKNKFKL